MYYWLYTNEHSCPQSPHFNRSISWSAICLQFALAKCAIEQVRRNLNHISMVWLEWYVACRKYQKHHSTVILQTHKQDEDWRLSSSWGETSQKTFMGLRKMTSKGLLQKHTLTSHLSTYRNISNVITADIKDSYLRAATNFPIINLGQTVVINPQNFEFSYML